MEDLSDSSILSNSSMAHIPLSARTSAPPSNDNSPVMLSLVIDAVRPTPDEPFPVVYTPRGATLATCFNSCDLATPGSPMRQILISPRIRIPSVILRNTPPVNCNNSARLISACPKISGAIDLLRIPIGSSAEVTLRTSESNRINSSSDNRSRWEASSNDFLCTEIFCASTKSVDIRPAFRPFAPYPSLTFCGKKIPSTVTTSPGFAKRVNSPRQNTLNDLGTAPIGTWLGSSCNLSS
mmetsp:Transcript_25626/g.28761  ORF Transcript_25626/g.28761 Transcript_25626/m.28761 type:complete len:238 (+) Transcript_25626:1129-1842(+)